MNPISPILGLILGYGFRESVLRQCNKNCSLIIQDLLMLAHPEVHFILHAILGHILLYANQRPELLRFCYFGELPLSATKIRTLLNINSAEN